MHARTLGRAGWRPDPAGVAFAAEQGATPNEIAAEVEAFRDHWLRLGEPRAGAQPGVGGSATG